MSRPTYTVLSQVKAKLPMETITEALDDDKDGVMDDDVWTAVLEEAANQVDSRLGQRYTVPFDPEDLPAIVSDASLTFVLETLYIRRGFASEDKNPFIAPARENRKKLESIGNGDSELTPTAQRPKKSVAVFTEPARTTSSSGSISG